MSRGLFALELRLGGADRFAGLLGAGHERQPRSWPVGERLSPAWRSSALMVAPACVLSRPAFQFPDGNQALAATPDRAHRRRDVVSKKSGPTPMAAASVGVSATRGIVTASFLAMPNEGKERARWPQLPSCMKANPLSAISRGYSPSGSTG